MTEFDFTQSVESLAPESRRVYYMLRRVAILAGDESQKPYGKVYTEAEVIAILGEDYVNVSVPGRCCR